MSMMFDELMKRHTRKSRMICRENYRSRMLTFRIFKHNAEQTNEKEKSICRKKISFLHIHEKKVAGV